MRKFYRSKPKVEDKKQYSYNQWIQSPELRVIDETGGQLGVITKEEALRIARERYLDLVEVSPNANPPVARIMDYKKFLYEIEKKRRKEKARQKKVETKGLRLSIKISEHDRDTKKNQALRFLEDGNKVKIEMILRGRENQHDDIAKKIVGDFIESINQQILVSIDQPINRMGNRLITIIGRK